ncbi:MAG: hypothetical protein ACLP00_07835 [Terracidiphilus sp.]
MMQTLILHSLGYFVEFLVLVALIYAVDRLGLLLWVAWLNSREGNPEHNGSRKYWRAHR